MQPPSSVLCVKTALVMVLRVSLRCVKWPLAEGSCSLLLTPTTFPASCLRSSACVSRFTSPSPWLSTLFLPHLSRALLCDSSPWTLLHHPSTIFIFFLLSYVMYVLGYRVAPMNSILGFFCLSEFSWGLFPDSHGSRVYQMMHLANLTQRTSLSFLWRSCHRRSCVCGGDGVKPWASGMGNV